VQWSRNEQAEPGGAGVRGTGVTRPVGRSVLVGSGVAMCGLPAQWGSLDCAASEAAPLRKKAGHASLNVILATVNAYGFSSILIWQGVGLSPDSGGVRLEEAVHVREI
jgi:hypothetical protein